MIKYKEGRNHSGKDRIKPKIYNSRYIHLKLLRDAISNSFKKYQKNTQELTIVDLGCGEKPYREVFSNGLTKYIGVDIPGNKNADYEIDLETGKSKLEDNFADIVISIQVLEHVQHVQKYLKECKRILKPNGNLMLSTHGYWIFHPDPGDYWRWTVQGLTDELTRAGFKVIKINGIMGLLSTSIQLFQDAVLLSFPLKRYWGKFFIIVMQFFISAANSLENKSKSLKSYRNRDACVFLVEAEKI